MCAILQARLYDIIDLIYQAPPHYFPLTDPSSCGVGQLTLHGYFLSLDHHTSITVLIKGLLKLLQ